MKKPKTYAEMQVEARRKELIVLEKCYQTIRELDGSSSKWRVVCALRELVGKP